MPTLFKNHVGLSFFKMLKNQKEIHTLSLRRQALF